jgi:hypothetical protein
MSKSQPRVFDKVYLLELLERDCAIYLNSPEKLNSGMTICFQCRCNKNVHKLFRDISYYGGAFCKDCIKKNKAMKIKETCIQRYGVINPSCIQEIKDKKEETYIEHYGMHPKKTEEVQEKYRNTCLKRYNTDNAAKTIEVKDKIKETFIEKYGGHPMYNEVVKEKVKETCRERYGGHQMHNEIIKGKVKETCLERYGCHPAQSIKIQEQIQKSGKTYRLYTMPSGEVRKIQGYEHFALDLLVKEYIEDQIKSNRIDVPRILYEYNNKQKYYFPDIYLPHINLIIEVKSTWTYKREEEQNNIKAIATRAQGYNFEFWIFDPKGNRIQL